MAALNIIPRTTGADWRAVITEQIIAGPGRDVVFGIRAAQPSVVSPPADGFAQPAGFRFVSYTPMAAVIEQASQFRGGQIQSEQRSVAWQDGDWKLVLQPDGKPGPYVASLRSLEGFVRFGAGV